MSSQNSQYTSQKAQSSEYSLIIHRSGLHGDRLVLSNSNAQAQTLYFVDTSAFHPNTPDVTLFAGPDKSGPILGVCKYTGLSSSIIVGRGDPANPNAVQWETLAKTSRDHSAYNFSVDLGSGEQRKAYTWKRTHDAELLGGNSSRLRQRSWKLIDDATGQVVAVFAAKGMTSWKNTGEMRFLEHQQMGKDWEEWVLLTYSGIYEKARRRAQARRDLSWFF